MREFAALRKHFQTADLRNALARGFRDEDRLRALTHFDGECPLCGASLGAALAERGPEAEHEDFVARALERLHDERRGTSQTAVDLTPVHHEWLLRALREPRAVSRLAIEEARWMALADPKRGDLALSRALEVVSDPRLGWFEGRWASSRALATVYRALDGPGEGGAPLKHVRVAEKHLEDAGLDYESHAVVFLSGFWLALRTRKRAKVDLYLRLAETCVEQFVETRSSPGHLAELRFAQGAELVRARRYQEARERFTEALRHVPERCARFRCRVHLSLATVPVGPWSPPNRLCSG
jgi:hypothetical protein